MAKLIETALERDIDRLLPLVRKFHEHEDLVMSDDERMATLLRLISDETWGKVWLIFDGTELAGYIAICIGYSIEFRGNDAFIDEFYVRPESRGRGLGTTVLNLIKAEAKSLGIRALHLEVARSNTKARKLYSGVQFSAREEYMLMTTLL
jgi:ribosomal protein S18 acetylase RimI-like enzyme